jgi:UDP-N-acetyl-2-amino-2-deoxyglucuronate dehydrogenase
VPHTLRLGEGRGRRDATGPGPGVGFALLGAGAGAEAHAAALGGIPGARLVVVADADLERARALTARHGGEPVADAETALAQAGVEAAVVVTPNHLHAELARACARRGIAVLVEKPLGRSLGEAREIVETCATAGTPLGLVLQNRFAPAAVALRDAVRAGELGRLVGAAVLVRCHRTETYFHAGPWRAGLATAGGGALLIQAIHTLDLLDWLVGPVAAATGVAATRAHRVEVEDVLAAALELPDGAPASLLATTAARPEFPARLEIFGTTGSAVLLEARGAISTWRGDGRTRALAELAALEGELAARLQAPWPAGVSVDLHRALLADFAESVRTGRPPAVDGRAALRLQALVEAIYAATRTGGRVPVTG